MKKFFKKIWSFLTLLFGNVENIIEQHAQPSIEVIKNLKGIADSTLFIAITDLIPGNWDNVLREKISKNLAKAIDLLVNVNDVVSQDDLSLKLYHFIEWLRKQTPALRAAVYAKLASKLTKLNATEDNIAAKNHSYDLLTQTLFSKQKENITDEQLDQMTEEDTTTN